jgi:hypothetical protein
MLLEAGRNENIEEEYERIMEGDSAPYKMYINNNLPTEKSTSSYSSWKRESKECDLCGEKHENDCEFDQSDDETYEEFLERI